MPVTSLGYAENIWPSQGAYWPDSPLWGTHSLSTQFGISSRNPFMVGSGYLQDPYHTQPYPGVGDWSAGYAFSQVSFVRQGSVTSNYQFKIMFHAQFMMQMYMIILSTSLLRSQFRSYVDYSKELKSQIFTVINRSLTLFNQISIILNKSLQSGYQINSLIDYSTKIGTQISTFIDRSNVSLNQFYVVINRYLSLNSQISSFINYSKETGTQVSTIINRSRIISSQILTVVNRSMTVGSQISIFIDASKSIMGQVYTVINRSKNTLAQFTAEINSETPLNSQFYPTINAVKTIKSQFYVVINRTETIFSQMYIIINREFGGKSQFIVAVKSVLSKCSQFIVTVNSEVITKTQSYWQIKRNTFGNTQFVAELSKTLSTLNSFLTKILVSDRVKSQFRINVNASKSNRSQIRFLVFENNLVNTQIYVRISYFEIAGGDYCKVEWPSYAWPYIHVNGYRSEYQYKVNINNRSQILSQFNISGLMKRRTNTQVYVEPNVQKPLFISYYAPLALDIEQGMPQYRFQWRFASTARLKTEVRWRPF